MNVSGKISADKIDVSSIKVENIDASKITTGDLDADRIKTNVINAINMYSGTATIDSAKIGEIDASKITTGSLSADIIATNVISAINASVGKISADRLDVDKLEVKDIDASLITTGDLDAERIQAQVIAAINSYTGTAKIKQAQIETLLVGSANITDLDVSKLVGDKIDASLIDVDKIRITDANITGTLSASKIQGGTLDASTINVTNLRAESITTGALTIDGDNLLRNSGWLIDSSKWTLEDGWVRMDTLFDNCHTQVITRVGLTQDDKKNLISETHECDSEGSRYVYSIYVNSPDVNGIDGDVLMEIVFKDSNAQDTGNATTSIKPTANNSWQRFVLSAAVPNNSSTIEVRVSSYRNGTIFVAKPMLQRGTVASEWKPHIDEQISDGAIDGDKIAEKAVGLSKLNLDELFVSGSAFINKLSAVEINATQITTGKISGERIDIQGIVTYEALDTELQPLFDVTGNKTYINGGMVAANTIKANSIDLLSGIRVTGPDNTTTFAIAEDGTVTINGYLQSGNYDESKKTGYKIGTNGKAILNEAIVRGRFELPNAGMTNDYDMSQVDGRNLVPNSEQEFVATGNEFLKTHDLTPIFDKYGLVPYTISFDLKSSDISTSDQIQVYLQSGSGSKYSFTNTLQVTTNYQRYYIHVTPALVSGSTVTTSLLAFYGTYGTGNYPSVKNIKVELGTVQEPEWIPAPEDSINPVRIWAGTSYELRDSAPFKVMQNGDVYATNARLTGILYGSVDSGWVEIDEKTLRIVNDTVNPEVEYVRLGVEDVMFNNDVLFGTDTDARIRYKNNDRKLEITNSVLNITNPGIEINMYNNDSWYQGIVISSNQPGHTSSLALGYSTHADYVDTIILTSNGAKGVKYGDICVRRYDGNEDVDVRVEGNVKVRNSIKNTRNTIEMRSVSDGWGFYAG